MNEDDELLAHYIEIGAVELSGVAEDGEFIYGLTDKAEEVAPELMEAHREHIDNTLIQLYDMGMIDITYDENLEATISLSEEGKIKAREYGIVQMNIDDMPDN